MAMVGGPRASSQIRVALCARRFVAIPPVLDQNQVAVAASSALIVGIAVWMAQDGVMSQHPIVHSALAASIPPRVLHSALATPTLAIQAAVASLVMTVGIVEMMARVGVISPAPIVQHVMEASMAVLHRRSAGERNPEKREYIVSGI